jgi:hypothetical protein
MSNEGLLLFVALQIGVVLAGIGGLWMASRKPRALAILIGMILSAGLGLVWYGSTSADDNYERGRRLFQAGCISILYALPALVLFSPGRRRTGDRVGPVGVRDWASGVGMYFGAWWAVAFLVGCIGYLGMAQSGSFR